MSKLGVDNFFSSAFLPVVYRRPITCGALEPWGHMYEVSIMSDTTGHNCYASGVNITASGGMRRLRITYDVTW
jgi:hypothetical protein